MLSRMASNEKIASTRAGGAQQMPDGGFRRGHGETLDIVADEPLHRLQFKLVSERRRCAVGVDIVEIARLDACALERGAHATIGTVTVFRR